MHLIRVIIAAVLFFAPVLVGWVLLYRLSAFRRDGGGFAATLTTSGLRLFRPDLYTDEGQVLLRWAWVVLAVMIPWCVAVAFTIG